MTSIDGENYVEAIAQFNKQIKLKIDMAKYENAKKIARSSGTDSGTGEIACIQIDVGDGVLADINYPERWLYVFALAQKRFAERFGADALATIQYHYGRGWKSLKTYTYQGISKRNYQDRRSKFLNMFLLYAVQNNLINVE